LAVQNREIPAEEWERLRMAYYMLKEGAVQPWPGLLVKIISERTFGQPIEGDGTHTIIQSVVNKLGKVTADAMRIQKVFIKMLQVSFPHMLETPFKTGASVVFYIKVPFLDVCNGPFAHVVECIVLLPSAAECCRVLPSAAECWANLSHLVLTWPHF
jgi:hypothetical protein